MELRSILRFRLRSLVVLLTAVALYFAWQHHREQQATAELRTLMADLAKEYEKPNVNFKFVNDKWVQDLNDFVEKYESGDSVNEATFQLALADEFSGNKARAITRYQEIVNSRSNGNARVKAKGAIKRLTSEGKMLDYSGPSFANPNEVIRTSDYRGKFVLIHFWATWQSVSDMTKLSQMKTFYEDRLEIIGVNIDTERQALESYFDANPQEWNHIYTPGGVDGESATDLGIITVPTVILLDPQGKMIKQCISVEEANNLIQSH